MRPERLSLDPNSADAELQWNHWQQTVDFFSELHDITDEDNQALSTNCLSAGVYNYVSGATNYTDAMEILQKLCQTEE